MSQNIAHLLGHESHSRGAGTIKFVGTKLSADTTYTDPVFDATVDLRSVLSTFDDAWQPRTVAHLNDYDIRVVKVRGEFTPHRHVDTDEVFFVLDGALTIRMPARDVVLSAGQLFVVPRGVEHQPRSDEGASIMLLEPRATVNTGDSPSHLTTSSIDITPSA